MKIKFFLSILILSVTLFPSTGNHKKLLEAAKQNDLKQVRLLIDNKANINTKNAIGQTPLHLGQDPNIIHELIIAGANINKTDRDGIAPLYQALLDNNKHKTLTLLYSGAKVNIMVNGFTPLQWAIEHNDYQLVFEFVKAGAKVTQQRITYAQVLGHNDIAQLLKNFYNLKGKKSRLHVLDKIGQTKLHNAVANNNAILIDSLVLAGLSINVKNAKGQTPLHIAVDQNSEIITQKLLDLQAKININDNNDQTPFHYATHNGSLQISNLLYEQGAALYLPDKQGITPLSYIKQNKNLASLLPMCDQQDNQELC